MFDAVEVATPGACAGAVLSTTAPEALDDADLVAFLQAADRQRAHLDAVIARATAAVADRVTARVRGEFEGLPGGRSKETNDLAERSAVVEVAAALRVSAASARDRIRAARDLAGRLLPARAALEAGGLSCGQGWVLARTMEDISDDALVARVQSAVLPAAPRQSVSCFGRAIRRALVRLDPTGAARDHRRAARSRTGTCTRDIEDGLGQLVVTAPAAQTQWANDTLDAFARALHHALTADAGRHARSGDAQAMAGAVQGARTLLQAWREDGIIPAPHDTGDASAADIAADTADAGAVPSISELRAWILLDLIARATTDPSYPREQGTRPVEAHVVIDLHTLLGLRDDPGAVNGQPVPAVIAREFADRSTLWRRLVTDPVDGHLLDSGPAFPTPARIVDHLLSRDAYCRHPGCYRRAAACDMEHAVPRHRHGPTSVANMGAYCPGHHTLKTAGLIDLINSGADGSVTLVTYLGQRVRIPPRPVLEKADPLCAAADVEPVALDDDLPPPF